jgi:pSer/pThr/pTyr-binding forkhead associated (FHA) protein
VAVLQQCLAEPEGDGGGAVPHLLCLTGLDVGKRFPLCDGTTSLGRGEEMNARIRDRAVSRRHARVLKLADGFALEDAGTSNGVFVNGARITGRVHLSAGDIVELGHTLLRFDEPQPGPAAVPSVAPEPRAEEARPEAEAPASTSPSAPGRIVRPGRFGWVEWLMIVGGAALTVVGLAVSLTLLR